MKHLGWAQMKMPFLALPLIMIITLLIGTGGALATGVCGDGILCSDPTCTSGPGGGPEQCDDGNLVCGDGCDPNCAVSGCGNGFGCPASGEQCDDGNTVSGDGCSMLCQAETSDTPAADKCQASKMKAAALMAKCLLFIDAKVSVKGGPPDYTKCTDNLAKAFARLEVKGGCFTNGDVSHIRQLIESSVSSLYDSLVTTQSDPWTGCALISGSNPPQCGGHCSGCSCSLIPGTGPGSPSCGCFPCF